MGKREHRKGGRLKVNREVTREGRTKGRLKEEKKSGDDKKKERVDGDRGKRKKR